MSVFSGEAFGHPGKLVAGVSLQSLGQAPRHRFGAAVEPGEPPEPGDPRCATQIILETVRRLIAANGCVMSLHDRQRRLQGNLSALGIDRAVALEVANGFAVAEADAPLYKVTSPH